MDHQQMAELTAIYFVLRPHGSVCIYWGNDTFEGKKKKDCIQKALWNIASPLPQKRETEK